MIKFDLRKFVINEMHFNRQNATLWSNLKKSVHFYIEQFAIIVRLSCIYRQMQVLIWSGGRADAKFFEKTYDKIAPFRLKYATSSRVLFTLHCEVPRSSSSSRRLNAGNSRGRMRKVARISVGERATVSKLYQWRHVGTWSAVSYAEHAWFAPTVATKSNYWSPHRRIRKLVSSRPQ